MVEPRKRAQAATAFDPKADSQVNDKPTSSRMERAGPWILGALIALLVGFLVAYEHLRYRGVHSTLPGACRETLAQVTGPDGKTRTVVACAGEMP